jgi:hypothetical protein
MTTLRFFAVGFVCFVLGILTMTVLTFIVKGRTPEVFSMPLISKKLSFVDDGIDSAGNCVYTLPDYLQVKKNAFDKFVIQDKNNKSFMDIRTGKMYWWDIYTYPDIPLKWISQYDDTCTAIKAFAIFTDSRKNYLQ